MPPIKYSTCLNLKGTWKILLVVLHTQYVAISWRISLPMEDYETY